MARGSGGKDRTKPVVNITSPTNLSTLVPGSTQTITVSATDNRSVSYVNVRIVRTYANGSVDLTSFNVNDVSAPYSYTWSVPNINYSTYSIIATAYDGSGNSAVHQISVNVNDGITTITTTIAPPPPPPVLPSSWILAAPTAINQGGEGSCAACSIACALSVTYYYHTGATSYSQSTNIFSPEYIYDKFRKNQLESGGCISWDCGGGSTGIANASIAKTNGCALWSVLPYSSQYQGCQADTSRGADFCTPYVGGSACHPCLLTTDVENAAANYKVTNYGIGYASDLYTMKRLIRNGHGLHIGGNVSANHNYAGGGDCNYVMTGPGDWVGSSHAWCIIGYDDTKQAALLQNSWGTNWGCNGRIWVSYDYLISSFSYYLWVTYRQDQNPYPFL